jgi:hypothetical protein
MVRRQREQLSRLAQAVTGIQAEAQLLVGRPATVLIQEVLRSNHDLLMRSHARDMTASGPRPVGAVDMELLRKCPRPVCLVRHVDPIKSRAASGAMTSGGTAWAPTPTSYDSHSLAFYLRGAAEGDWRALMFTVQDGGARTRKRVVDTSLTSPSDFSGPGFEMPLQSRTDSWCRAR